MKNTEKRKGGWRGTRISLVVACLALLILVFAVLPASAATEYLVVNRYAANNYSYAESSVIKNWTEMQASMPTAYSNGPVYMQGPTFDSADPYGTAGQNMILYYGHNGTYVSDLTDLVGGMAAGDEIFVKASDGMTRYFNYTNVYAPASGQGDLVLAWWDSTSGAVPGYSEGIRSFFYTPPESYGVADSLNLTLIEMQDSLAPWYRYNYSSIWPSAKGLSVKYVNQLMIYPPHRHDFNTTGDTTGWAFRREVSVKPPAAADVPSDDLSPISNIEDNDGVFQTDFSDCMYAAHRFVFNIDTSAAKDGPLSDIEKINITWNGKGWHDTGGTANGTYLYIWDGTAYEELANNSGDGSEVSLTGTVTADIADYINSGNVTVIAVQKTAGADEDMSNVATDYIGLIVTHHHHN